jgi:membrane protein implicated in regulation of membrane protease activity
MIEGLITILFMSFVSLIITLLGKWGVWGVLVIVLQAISVLISAYLLIRVRVKISRAEKEKLRFKIEELEGKITSMGKK